MEKIKTRGHDGNLGYILYVIGTGDKKCMTRYVFHIYMVSLRKIDLFFSFSLDLQPKMS